MRVKVIINDGVTVGVLSDCDVEIEIIDDDRDYEDHEHLENTRRRSAAILRSERWTTPWHTLEKTGSLIHGHTKTEEGKWVKEKPTNTTLAMASRIECKVHSEKFPDGMWRDVQRFMVPGWKECSITGLREDKRIIRGLLNLSARNAFGIE